MRSCFFNKEQLSKPLQLEKEAGTSMFQVSLSSSEQCALPTYFQMHGLTQIPMTASTEGTFYSINFIAALSISKSVTHLT